jgi:preprotein translocase subunit SecA
VANDQRKVIYEQRSELMAADDISATIKAIRHDVVNIAVSQYIPPQSIEEQWDKPGLTEAISNEFSARLDIPKWLEEDHSLHEETLRERILTELVALYEEKEKQAGAQVLRHFEKAVMLQVLDSQWKEHLASMDHLRQGIHLRGYAQKNPKQEYKREAFEMFRLMLDRVKYDVIGILSKVQVRAEEDVQAMEEKRRAEAQYRMEHAQMSGGGDEAQTEQGKEGTVRAQPVVRDGKKVGRNDPCPCGSGKKFKQCHGKIA